jgi:hypothetical protein
VSTDHPGVTGRRSGASKEEEARSARVVAKPKNKKKAKKPRPERKEMVRARRAASKMTTVEELAAVLGIGRNLARELVTGKKGDPDKGTPDEPSKVPSLRFGRRYLIPRIVIDKLVGGELVSAATRSDA